MDSFSENVICAPIKVQKVSCVCFSYHTTSSLIKGFWSTSLLRKSLEILFIQKLHFCRNAIGLSHYCSTNRETLILVWWKSGTMWCKQLWPLKGRLSKAFLSSNADQKHQSDEDDHVVKTGSDSSTAKSSAIGVSVTDHYKRMPHVTVGETPLLNSHECRALVKMCSPSPVMVTSPYDGVKNSWVWR